MERSSGPPASGLAETIPTTTLLAMYVMMVRIRQFEERVAELLVDGEIRCPVHLYTGQEGIAAGVCATLQPEDYIFGGHRSHGHYLAKGGDLNKLMAEMYGKSTGCSQGRGGSMHLVAPEVGILGTVPIVGATIPLTVGTAMASQLRGDGRVSVSFFGDGTVEEGTFHESMNLAASRALPVVFICENNLYSSHLYILERRAKDNIVQSAEAHGMPGCSLDGNDALAVHLASQEAVERARNGNGPTLLECRTYRWRGHVGPSTDLDVGVERKDNLDEWRAQDPIPRLRAYLLTRDIPAEKLDGVLQEAEEAVEEGIAAARAAPYPDPMEMDRYLFKTSAGTDPGTDR